MKRRTFVKSLPLVVLAPAALKVLDGELAYADSTGEKVTGKASSRPSTGSTPLRIDP